MLPAISTATANGGSKAVLLTMNDVVTGAPDNSDFAVTVGGNANAVTGYTIGTATVGGETVSTITLTLTSVIANGSTVAVGYTKSSTAEKQLTDAAGNAVASLGSSTKSVDLTDDAVGPTVLSVTSSSDNDTYKIGDTVNVQVVFSEVVNVNTSGGTPKLTLETGTSDRAVNYTSGTGTDTLLFAYTVQQGDTSDDLNYASTTALALNGGTIKDLAANSATTGTTVTMPALDAAASLASNKNIVIDGKIPTIDSIAAAGGSKDVVLSMSENITGDPATTDFSVLVNGNSKSVGSISDTSAATNSITLTLASVVPNDAVVTVDYAQNSTASKKLVDAAGNYVATVGDPIAATVTDDTVSPTVVDIRGTNGTYNAGDNVDLVLEFSEAVSVQGTPKLLLATGDVNRSAEYLSTSADGTEVTFRYTVQTGDRSTDLNYHSDSALNFGTDGMIKDLALNTANLSLAALTSASNSLADDFAIVIA